MPTQASPRALRRPLLVLLGALVVGSASQAQERFRISDEELFPDAKRVRFDKEAQWSIDLGASAQTAADLDDANGELSLTRWHGLLRYEWPQTRRSALRIGYLHEDSNYDFDAVLPLGLMTPFSDMKEDAVELEYFNNDPESAWMLNAGFALGREQGASPSEGFYARLVTGKMWGLSEDFQLGIAALVYSKIEDEAEVIPFPIFRWRLSDDLSAGFRSSRMPSFELRYDWCENLDLYARGSYEVRQFKVEDRVAISSGAVTDEEVSLLAGLEYRHGSLEVELFGGLARHRFSLESDEALFARDNTDPQGVAGLRLSWQQ